MSKGTIGQKDPTQLGVSTPDYQSDLPAYERNLGNPGEQAEAILANTQMLAPLFRAGDEALQRGENFFGGTPQYERQRQALAQYYSDASDAMPDAIASSDSDASGPSQSAGRLPYLAKAYGEGEERLNERASW